MNKHSKLFTGLLVSLFCFVSCSNLNLIKHYESVNMKTCRLGVYIAKNCLHIDKNTYFSSADHVKDVELSGVQSAVYSSLIRDLTVRTRFSLICKLQLDSSYNYFKKKDLIINLGEEEQVFKYPDSNGISIRDARDARFVLLIEKMSFDSHVEIASDGAPVLVGGGLITAVPSMIIAGAVLAATANKILCVDQCVYMILWDNLEKRSIKSCSYTYENKFPLVETQGLGIYDYWTVFTLKFVDDVFQDTPFLITSLPANRFK